MANENDDVDIYQDLEIKENEDPLFFLECVYNLWWRWANFELYITQPQFEHFRSPKLILPKLITDSDEQYEYVYPIYDHGDAFITSKGEEMFNAGMSMCKLYYTIEKIIYLLIERLKDTGITQDEEVQVIFNGHNLAQRKAFEIIINLNYNVVVTNFNAGSWGENYLKIVKRMADLGYGYVSEAPRKIFSQIHDKKKKTNLKN